MILTSVDLPAPLSPSRATTSPRPIREADAAQRLDGAEILGDVLQLQQWGIGHHAASVRLLGTRGRCRPRPARTAMPNRGESTPATARAAAPRSTALPPSVRQREARGVAVRRVPRRNAPAARRRRPAGVSSASSAEPAEDDGLRIEQVLDGHDGGAQQRRGFGDPALHADGGAAPFHRFERQIALEAAAIAARSRARHSGPAAHGRSRRHCRRRRAPARPRAPGSRRGRRRNRDSRIRAGPAPRHTAVRPRPRPPSRPR